MICVRCEYDDAVAEAVAVHYRYSETPDEEIVTA